MAFRGPIGALACRAAILDAELCLPGADGVPDFVGLHCASTGPEGAKH